MNVNDLPLAVSSESDDDSETQRRLLDAISSSTKKTPVPSLFAAIQELGVKLESNKATLPVVIIESVRPPSPN